MLCIGSFVLPLQRLEGTAEGRGSDNVDAVPHNGFSRIPARRRNRLRLAQGLRRDGSRRTGRGNMGGGPMTPGGVGARPVCDRTVAGAALCEMRAGDASGTGFAMGPAAGDATPDVMRGSGGCAGFMRSGGLMLARRCRFRRLPADCGDHECGHQEKEECIARHGERAENRERHQCKTLQRQFRVPGKIRGCPISNALNPAPPRGGTKPLSPESRGPGIRATAGELSQPMQAAGFSW